MDTGNIEDLRALSVNIKKLLNIKLHCALPFIFANHSFKWRQTLRKEAGMWWSLATCNSNRIDQNPILSVKQWSSFKLIEKCTEILPDKWENKANVAHNWDSSNPIQNACKESSPWHPFSGLFILLKITASCSGQNPGVGCGGLCDSCQAIERGKNELMKTISWEV